MCSRGAAPPSRLLYICTMPTEGDTTGVYPQATFQDRVVGLALIAVALLIFSYYTVWVLVTVRSAAVPSLAPRLRASHPHTLRTVCGGGVDVSMHDVCVYRGGLPPCVCVVVFVVLCVSENQICSFTYHLLSH